MKTLNQQTDWEKEFDKKFKEWGFIEPMLSAIKRGTREGVYGKEVIKSFIFSIVIPSVLKNIVPNYDMCDCGYDNNELHITRSDCPDKWGIGYNLCVREIKDKIL